MQKLLEASPTKQLSSGLFDCSRRQWPVGRKHILLWEWFNWIRQDKSAYLFPNDDYINLLIFGQLGQHLGNVQWLQSFALWGSDLNMNRPISSHGKSSSQCFLNSKGMFIACIYVTCWGGTMPTWHWGGPQEKATISLAIFFSFIRTASSIAISSKGFIECLTPSVMTPDLSGLTRI